MLGTLTTALATMATKVEQLSLGQASQVSSLSAQPGTRAWGNPTATSSQVSSLSAQPGARAGGNPTATASASTDLHMEQHVWNMVEHRVRTAHIPALAITDDEADGEEEARPQAPRGAARTSGKLRSANTAAVHRVTWPHEYVYTPEGQPSEYESMSSMAFVTG